MRVKEMNNDNYFFEALTITTKDEYLHSVKHYKRLVLVLENLPVTRKKLSEIFNFCIARKTKENNYEISWLIRLKLIKKVKGKMVQTEKLVNFIKSLGEEIERYELRCK